MDYGRSRSCFTRELFSKQVASALGARVIAVGRDLGKLKTIAASNERVSIVLLQVNVEE
jgi:hypothetical protein